MGFAKFMGNMAMINKVNIFGLGLGALIFFVLSFLLFVQIPESKNHMDIDSGAYVQAANFFLQDGSFAILKQSPYYGLGYPLLLAFLKKIGNNSLNFIIVMQVMLAWLVTIFAWKIALRLYTAREAWIAYGLAVTSLGILVFAQFLLTEILLILFLYIALERLLYFLSSHKLIALCGAGFFLGLSCIVKAVAFPLVFFLMIFIALFSRASRAFVFRNILIFFVAFIVPYGGYLVHNAYVFKENTNTTMVKINLYYWYYPHLRAAIYQTNADVEKHYLQKNMPIDSISSLLIADVCNYPGKALLVLLKNYSKTLFGLYVSNVKLLVDDDFVSGCLSFFRIQGSFIDRLWGYIAGNTSHTWIKILGSFEALFLLFNYFCMVFGLWALYVRQRWWDLSLVLLYTGYFIGITGHDGCARFRMMIEVVIVVCAAGGLVSIFSSLSRTNKMNLLK